VLIPLSQLVEIGDPLVDSEHRYLTELINNLHAQYEEGKEAFDLNVVFTHLTKYIRVHFRNEEALMQAIGYPQLREHRQLHEKLVQQFVELGEEYLDGSDSAEDDMFAFLKEWWMGHIGVTDPTMTPYLGKERPDGLEVRPAFAGDAGPDFKKCTMCGNTWHTFEDLAADKTKTLRGCQIDLTNHLYNLIMFNCSCDTTLAVFVSELVTNTDIPFVITNNDDPDHRPDYCMKEDKTEPCLDKCACAYTTQVLQALE